MKKNGKILTTLILVIVLVAGLVVPATAAPSQIKNVIFFVGDGTGFNQYLAADYYLYGKEGKSPAEQFPVKLAMSTYSRGILPSTVDDAAAVYSSTLWDNYYAASLNPTESSAAASAMSTGTKTFDAAIGVNQDKIQVKHMTADFEALGMATGVVTTVPFSHATPAGFVAHNEDRNNYFAIADEMIKSSATDVIIGAGNPLYNDSGVKNEKGKETYKFISQATWDALVAGTITTADANGDGKADPWKFIQTKAEFEALQTGAAPDRVLGIAQCFQTFQEQRGAPDTWGKPAFTVPYTATVPDLKTISLGALNVLDNDKDGFFLMIEAGAGDWAGHFMQPGRLIEEMDDFYKAVDAVSKWVETNSSWEETLMIVTGDHETGYLTAAPGVNSAPINNGKGVMPTMYYFPSPVYKTIAWHTNQLIPFFAKGVGSELFNNYANQTDTVRGKYIDNTEIPMVIRNLLGTGPSQWAANDVYLAIEKSLVPMVTQNNYQSNMTREQFCNLAYETLKKASGMPIMDPSTAFPMPFTDTTSKTIYTLNLFGIIGGATPTLFAPNDLITREQAATLLSKMAAYLGVAIPKSTAAFKDQATISSWALKAVNDMSALGVMNGTGSNNFSPKTNYTLEQTISSLLRLYNIKSPA